MTEAQTATAWAAVALVTIAATLARWLNERNS